MGRSMICKRLQRGRHTSPVDPTTRLGPIASRLTPQAVAGDGVVSLSCPASLERVVLRAIAFPANHFG